MNEAVVLRCQALSKSYQERQLVTDVLQRVSLEVKAGERVAIIGSSGSGKSTLLHLLGGLDKPTSGDVEVVGQQLSALSVKALAQLRNRHIGFVYQFHHLLAEFTAVENVAMPLFIAGEKRTEALVKAEDLLNEVGLTHRLHHKPAELSGGERQRTAIARALVHEPQLVLADEPTGNLDGTTAKQVFELLDRLNQRRGTAFVVVTHDLILAQRMDRSLHLHQGVLEMSS